MPVRYTLICHSHILLYAGATYSDMPLLYISICQSYILLYAVLYTLICRSYILLYAGPTYSYMPVLHTLICGPIYSYMPVLHTLICGPTYSYMPVLHTLICWSYIFFCAGHIYWSWCLTPLSAIFQLYRGSQYYWRKQPEIINLYYKIKLFFSHITYTSMQNMSTNIIP
jgi:hypothetical protein